MKRNLIPGLGMVALGLALMLVAWMIAGVRNPEVSNQRWVLVGFGCGTVLLGCALLLPKKETQVEQALTRQQALDAFAATALLAICGFLVVFAGEQVWVKWVEPPFFVVVLFLIWRSVPRRKPAPGKDRDSGHQANPTLDQEVP